MEFEQWFEKWFMHVLSRETKFMKPSFTLNSFTAFLLSIYLWVVPAISVTVTAVSISLVKQLIKYMVTKAF